MGINASGTLKPGFLAFRDPAFQLLTPGLSGEGVLPGAEAGHRVG